MDSNKDENTNVIKLNGSLDSKDIHNDEITCLSGTEAKPDTKVEMDSPPKYLIYGIKDSPPIHITIICGIQVNCGKILLNAPRRFCCTGYICLLLFYVFSPMNESFASFL